MAVVLGLSAAAAGYSATQLVRRGCVHPWCPAAPTAFPASMEGVWTGRIQQTDGRAWAIELTINEGARVATVRYPELRCTGTLTFDRATTSELRAREHINSGDCTADGAVTLAATGGGLDWTYRPDGETYTADGRLVRVARPS
jgi:hypothetical protein